MIAEKNIVLSFFIFSKLDADFGLKKLQATLGLADDGGFENRPPGTAADDWLMYKI